MCVTTDVTEYPEEGFAVLSDSRGQYLAFRDTDHIEVLRDDPDARYPSRYFSSERNTRCMSAIEEFLDQD